MSRATLNGVGLLQLLRALPSQLKPGEPFWHMRRPTAATLRSSSLVGATHPGSACTTCTTMPHSWCHATRTSKRKRTCSCGLASPGSSGECDEADTVLPKHNSSSQNFRHKTLPLLCWACVLRAHCLVACPPHLCVSWMFCLCHFLMQGAQSR